MGVEAIVEERELDFMSAGARLPCLTFIACPLDSGDERAAWREARRMAPELWADGLELTAMLALETARREEVAGASEAIEAVQRNGPRSAVVAAIVWRLAEQMVEDIRRGRVERQREPSGASARTGWPVTSAITSKSRS